MYRLHNFLPARRAFGNCQVSAPMIARRTALADTSMAAIVRRRTTATVAESRSETS